MGLKVTFCHVLKHDIILWHESVGGHLYFKYKASFKPLSYRTGQAGCWKTGLPQAAVYLDHF